MKKIIDSDVSLRDLCLTELLDLSDVLIHGYYDCSKNSLTNLVGSPHTIYGRYDCSENPKLNSLKGIPKTVKGDFWIDLLFEDLFPGEYIHSLCNIGGKIIYAKYEE